MWAMTDPIRVGTRASVLARTQTAQVARALEQVSERACEEVLVRTVGDDTSRPLDQLGQGVFVSALREALRAGEVDVVVHSYKDLPSAPADGVHLGAVPVRADPHDVLVSRSGERLAQLLPGAVVGTSSPRRQAALRRLRPDLVAVPVRGNVDSRVRQVRDGRVDAVVLARAGLQRLGRADEAAEVLTQLLPAPAQGALAVECRADDEPVRQWLQRLDDPGARLTTAAERHVLVGVGATCTTPVAALAEHDGTTLRLRAELTDDGGHTHLADAEVSCALGDVATAAALGLRAAAHLNGNVRDGLVLLVRDGSADPDLAALRGVGLAGVSDPYIRVGAHPDPRPGAEIAELLEVWAGSPAERRWVVATSPSAVLCWEATVAPGRLRAAVAGAVAAGVRAAAVGERTAATLRAVGFPVVVVPPGATSADLVALLSREPAGEALLPAGDLALPTMVEGLSEHGWSVHRAVVYRTRPVDEEPASTRLLQAGEIAAVVLRSPSAARAFASVAPGARVPVVCGGPTTARAAAALGLMVGGVAVDPTPAVVADAVRQVVRR
jgi:hydroxymethylbilane synthase